MSFATGFFNTAGDEITKRQDYIREKRAKDRDFLMTYGVQAVTGAKSKVNKYVTTGMQLESMGLTKDNINYLVDTSGPEGLSSLYARVKDYTPDQLSADVFNSMVENTAGYAKRTKDGMSYEDTIGKAFGLYKDNVTDDPAENEKVGFWSSMLFDPNAADAALDERYIGGYTGRDIKRIMGTVSPSMTAPLAIDFSLLPKIHSDTVLLRYATDRKTIMQAQAENYYASIEPTPENAATESEPDKNNRLKLAKAIKAKDYGVFLELVPDIKSSLLTFDSETRGGLSNNPSFLSIPGLSNFFIDEARKREEASGEGGERDGEEGALPYTIANNILDKDLGASNVDAIDALRAETAASSEAVATTARALLQSKHTSAKKKYSNIPDLDALVVYSSEAAALRSDDEFFIVGNVIGRNPQAGKSSFESRGSFDQDVDYFLNAFTVGGVGLAEEADTQGGELVKGIAKGMYIAPAYFRASMLAIDRFMTKLPVGIANFLNSETEAGQLRSALVKDQTDIMALLTAAKESNSSAETIEALEERLRKGIESLPEDLQSTVIKIAENIDDIDIDISEVLPTAEEETQTLGSWWRSLSNYGDSEQEVGYNDPDDVRAAGGQPYTEMVPSAYDFTEDEYAALPVIASFNTVEAQLKTGELKQGSQFIYRNRPYTIDQTGAGAIGKVDIREFK